jgi:mono/diheme cytochrome c family protein
VAGARIIDDEKKSYSALFLIAVGLLLAGAVWSVWDDNITRRPWKKYQSQFFALEVSRARSALQQEAGRLGSDPAYLALQQQLATAQQQLASGDVAKQLVQLQARRGAINVKFEDAEFDLRLVKSKLEEAWYEYEHALLTRHPVDAPKKHIAELNDEKAEIEKRLAEIQGQLRQIDAEIAESKTGVKGIEDQLREAEKGRLDLERKLEGLLLQIGPFELPRVPRIEQVVLEEFDRNHFNNPVARVDRCTSCHAAVEKAGFEAEPNPFKTHPHRDVLLSNHPPDRFGCTPCHQGQGAAVNSVEKAHGEVKFWEHELLRGSKVQASCIKCHIDVALPGAEVIAHGERLFLQLGCHGCHLVEGYESIEKVGPYLRRLAAKVEPGWLIRWLENPHRFRERTKMPNFLFDRGQATAIAAYLLHASREDSDSWLSQHPAQLGVDPRDPQKVAAGRALADGLGCRGCHGLAPGESPALLGADKDLAPNLGKVAEKTDARWLFHWLKNPRGYSPVARMPNLRLSDEEAVALASFLLTLGEREPHASLNGTLQEAELIAQGEKLVRKYGCAGCHDVAGMENESRIGVELSTFGSKPREELFFGNHTDIPNTWDDWTYHKLKDPRTYQTDRIEQVMPQFKLADSDIDALRVFLHSRMDERVPQRYHAPDAGRAKALTEGRRLVEKYNCVGCHVIEGAGGVIRARYEETPTMAPPILNGEGAKVQPDWLFAFLKQPSPIRPWLQVRMPTFGLSDEETHTLVEYFLAQETVEIPFVHVDETAIPAEHVAAGKVLASNEYFDCFSCHQQGDKKPEGPPEGWAPDLAMARRRLNPDWIVRWLEDPQRVQPGTKMPSFYPGGPEDVLQGDEQRQIRALRDYLMMLGNPGATITQAADRGGERPGGSLDEDERSES